MSSDRLGRGLLLLSGAAALAAVVSSYVFPDVSWASDRSSGLTPAVVCALASLLLGGLALAVGRDLYGAATVVLTLAAAMCFAIFASTETQGPGLDTAARALGGIAAAVACVGGVRGPRRGVA